MISNMSHHTKNKLPHNGDESQLSVFINDFELSRLDMEKKNKIEELKSKIKNGDYEVNSQEIANALIRKLSSD